MLMNNSTTVYCVMHVWSPVSRKISNRSEPRTPRSQIWVRYEYAVSARRESSKGVATHAPSEGRVAVGAPQPSSAAFAKKATEESLSLTVFFFASRDWSFLLAAESLQRVLVSERTD